MSKHIGSSFDDYLDEEGLLAEAEAIAVKRVIAFQLEELMKQQKLSKTQLAKRRERSKFRVRFDLNFQHAVEATFKINTQLRQCLTPVLDRHCPFLRRIQYACVE